MPVISTQQFARLTGHQITDATQIANQFVSFVTYDKALASEALEQTNNKEKQRALRKAHVDSLVIAMSEGGFQPTSDCVAFGVVVDENGNLDVELSNGQHRLSALNKTIKPLAFSMPIMYSVFPSDMERRNWFALHDGGKVRTQKDRNKVLGTDKRINAITGVKGSDNRVVPALKWLSGELKDSANKPHQISGLITKFSTPMRDYYRLISGPNNINPKIGYSEFAAKMLAAPVMAVFFFLLNANPQDGHAIISAVMDSAKGDVEQPDTVKEIHNLIANATLGSGTDRKFLAEKLAHLIAEHRAKGQFDMDDVTKPNRIIDALNA